MSEKLSLSIIVTSYTVSRLEDICKLLESIERQTCRGLEVVFVSDRDSGLAGALEHYIIARGFRTFRFKIVVNSGDVGVNNCRNLGILNSTGDIVGLVDDDTVLFPDWAERTLNEFTHDSKLVGLTGPALPLWENPTAMSWFPQELYFVWGCTVWNWTNRREIRNVGGMNCSFRRDALVRVGLYDPRIGPRGGEEKIGWFFPSGEEVDLSIRVKLAFPWGRIVYDPRIMIFHKVEASRFNLPFVVKRAFRFGYTKRYLELKFRRRFNRDLLELERDHLLSLIVTSSITFFHSFAHEPKVATKRIMLVLLGAVSAVTGYLCYSLRPFTPLACHDSMFINSDSG